ncbi:GH11712 [Drosophila grimshawi]|uniref:GH11712 n=1 Tax=Drosophila grimshawi TaxID=7222 RepID=B4JD42_DROGR|nr:GH11712 [Drosophila grimshawi]
MFLKRILDRKDTLVNTNASCEDAQKNVSVEHKDNNNNNNNPSSVCLNKMQRRNGETSSAVQLTPLWEHILRTRRLPETICPATMFDEFHERLQDPEWQVRQHALRVLVDVLVVMRSKADKHSMHFLNDLIKNLGHQAPTVRKGALDCLRVYLTETAMPEMVMLQILDTGLSQPSIVGYDERLSCGVLLSLPPLLQSILHTPQRHFITKHTLERLVQRLQHHESQQEITLKVLSKIAELLGLQEFESYLDEMELLDDCGGLSLYNHLCRVYGILNKPYRAEANMTSAGAWRALPREHTWRDSSQESAESLPDKGKVIMETEIKINDDTLTMRILEAETETEESVSPIIDATELVCRPLAVGTKSSQGILQIISDSDVEEMVHNESLLGTPFRGLKRVTFGGEVVKMRTPDSDAASSANNNIDSTLSETSNNPIPNPNPITLHADEEHKLREDAHAEDNISRPKMTALTLEIPSDNTKPLPRGNSFLKEPAAPTTNDTTNNSNASPKRDSLSHSPIYRSCSISPAGSSSVSPKVPHKQIEVMHNLQRDSDPSPRSLRRSESVTMELATPPTAVAVGAVEPAATPNNWEELDIVNYKTIMDLRSGVSRTFFELNYIFIARTCVIFISN